MEILNWWEDFYDDTLTDVILTKTAEPVYNFISEFLSGIRNLKVFDKCCGNGYLTNEFAVHGYRATGVDASEIYIDFANKNYGSDNCKFIQADAKTFVNEEKFDIGIN